MLTLRSVRMWLIAIFSILGGSVLAADDLPGSDLLARLKAKVKEDQPFNFWCASSSSPERKRNSPPKPPRWPKQRRPNQATKCSCSSNTWNNPEP